MYYKNCITEKVSLNRSEFVYKFIYSLFILSWWKTAKYDNILYRLVKQNFVCNWKKNTSQQKVCFQLGKLNRKTPFFYETKAYDFGMLISKVVN